jgi:hypothetical protein
MIEPMSAHVVSPLPSITSTSPGLRDLHRGVDHQVVAGSHLDRERGAREAGLRREGGDAAIERSAASATSARIEAAYCEACFTTSGETRGKSRMISGRGAAVMSFMSVSGRRRVTMLGVKRILPAFEHRSAPVIPRRQFLLRLAHSGAISAGFIVVSLFAGMLGFHGLEGLSWIDAFLNASMLLAAWGPVHTPGDVRGKALRGPIRALLRAGGPRGGGRDACSGRHRIIHKFHMEGREGRKA